jgi:hypothetical protein
MSFNVKITKPFALQMVATGLFLAGAGFMLAFTFGADIWAFIVGIILAAFASAVYVFMVVDAKRSAYLVENSNKNNHENQIAETERKRDGGSNPTGGNRGNATKR